DLERDSGGLPASVLARGAYERRPSADRPGRGALGNGGEPAGVERQWDRVRHDPLVAPAGDRPVLVSTGHRAEGSDLELLRDRVVAGRQARVLRDAWRRAGGTRGGLGMERW